MNGFRGKTRNTALLSAVSIMVLSIGLSSQGLAQNIVHSGGGTYDYSGGTYSPTGRDNQQSGIAVTGPDTTVNASDMTIIGVDGVNDTGVYAITNATVNLNNVDISNVYFGVNINNSSTATIIGGTIDSQETAINASNTGSSISVTDTIIRSATSVGAVDVSAGNNFTMRGGSITNTGAGTGISALGETLIDGTTVTANGTAIYIQGANANLTARNFTATAVNANSYGVDINSGASANLTNGVITTSGSNAHGIWLTRSNTTPYSGATLEADNLDITTTGFNAHGVMVGNLSHATISNSRINVASGYGVHVDPNEFSTTIPHQASAIVTDTIITLNGTTAGTSTGLLANTTGSRIDAFNTDINVNMAGGRGVSVEGGATISMRGGNITMTEDQNISTFVGEGGTISLNNVTITGSGATNRGIRFLGSSSTGTVNLTDSNVTIENGAGIFMNGGRNNVTLRNSTMHADQLLYAGYSTAGSSLYVGTIDVEAIGSTLSGSAYVHTYGSSNLVLRDGSSWTVDIASEGPADSSVSTLGLHDSSIIFAAPTGADGLSGYKSLIIGEGYVTTEDVYNATGTSSLTLNTFLNEGGALSNQYTDRVLINGNVSGTTMVNVIGHANSTGGLTSVGGNNLASEGISIIQVSGTAAEDSFQLAGEYTTVAGLPYQYRLYAYGPDATLGEADEEQRLVTGTDPYWDYRLQNVYYELPPEPPVDPTDPTDPTNPGGDGGNNGNGNGNGWVPKVPVVAPQVTNYIIAPVALFQAGISDMGTLHQRLGEIRNQNGLNNGGNSLANKGEVFMRAYGGAYSYDSDRSLYQYGYNADIDYAAMQAGANLFALESPDSITRFGLTASYGQLSFEPKDVMYSEKTDLDVWSIAGHASYMHDSGFYLDGILAYGGFSGEVSNRLRGRTADLDGTRFMASIEAGYPIALNNGLVIEPQVQLIYQHLDFDRQMDVDQFAVAMGSQDLVTARIGGRVTKTFDNQADGRIVELYAKANYLPTFSNGDDIFLGDNFTLGEYGDAVEGGIGVSASFDNDMSVFGETSYRQRVSSGGVSGINLNGGLRYQF